MEFKLEKSILLKKKKSSRVITIIRIFTHTHQSFRKNIYHFFGREIFSKKNDTVTILYIYLSRVYLTKYDRFLVNHDDDGGFRFFFYYWESYSIWWWWLWWINSFTFFQFSKYFFLYYYYLTHTHALFFWPRAKYRAVVVDDDDCHWSYCKKIIFLCGRKTKSQNVLNAFNHHHYHHNDDYDDDDDSGG